MNLKTLALVAVGASFVTPKLSLAAPLLVRVGTVAPEGTPWEVQVRQIAKELKQASSGNVKLKVFLGGQKGDEKSLVRQCKAGSLEMIGVSTAALATEVPDLQVLELPFLFDSSEQADFVLDNYLRKPVEDIVQRYGFVLYQWAENGWQSFGTTYGHVKSAADLAGRKIRSQEAPVHITAWKAFGASPVEMGVSEVLPALKTGLVDGFAQTPLFTFAAGWHQGIKYYTVSRHVYQPAAIVYSKKFFDAQPKETQQQLLSDIDALTAAGRHGVRAIEAGLLQNFVNYGIDVYTLTPKERSNFAKAAVKVRKEYLKGASKDAKKLLALIDKGKQAYDKKVAKQP